MTSETGKRDFEAPETEAETELPEGFDTTGFDANVDTSGFDGGAGSARTAFSGLRPIWRICAGAPSVK